MPDAPQGRFSPRQMADETAAGVYEVPTDPIQKLADKALLRCTSHDWTEALHAARVVVDEAGTGLGPRMPGVERLAVLVALRMIHGWMRQDP
jgi:hypothetical protein